MRYLLSLILLIVPEIVFAQQSLDTLWVRVIRKLDGTTVKILDTLEFSDGTKIWSRTGLSGIGSIDSTNFQKYPDTLGFDFTRTQFDTEILKYVAKSDSNSWLPTWDDINAKNYLTTETGDISNVSVTSPITGGGTSGSVTIGWDSTALNYSKQLISAKVSASDSATWLPTWADILALNYLKASDTTWIGTQYRLWSGQTANYLPYWTGTRYEKSPIKRSGNDSTEFGTSATSNTHTLYMGDNGRVRIARHASQYMDFQSTSSYHLLLAYGTKDFVIGTASANTLQFFTKNTMRGKVDTLGTLNWNASIYAGTGTIQAGVTNMLNNYNSNVGLLLKPTGTGGGRHLVAQTSAGADVFEISSNGAIIGQSNATFASGYVNASGFYNSAATFKWWLSGAWRDVITRVNYGGQYWLDYDSVRNINGKQLMNASTTGWWKGKKWAIDTTGGLYTMGPDEASATDFVRINSDTWYSNQHGNMAIAPATQALVASRIRAFPFIVTRPYSIDSVRFEVSTGVAGCNVALGLYLDTDGDLYPDSLAIALGAYTCASAAVKGDTSTVALVAGGTSYTFRPNTLYFVAWHSNSTATLRAVPLGGQTLLFGHDPAMGASTQRTCWSATLSYTYPNACPTVFPAGANYLANAQAPLILWRVKP